MLELTPVSKLMTPNPFPVPHGTTVREAALVLADRGVGAAMVVDDAGRPIGVVSRSDVLRAVNAGADGAAVRGVMSPAVIAVQPDADALQASEVMVRCAVRRVFVTNEDGAPLGVVSATDLFRALKAFWGELAASGEAG
jgi:CBS domain-containing protein